MIARRASAGEGRHKTPSPGRGGRTCTTHLHERDRRLPAMYGLQEEFVAFLRRRGIEFDPPCGGGCPRAAWISPIR
jgi:hypothetical protein